ncbi:type IV pilus modification protein PilV [Variovorax sp. PAMC 28711]|uniref:type IV pilus modification protein PilV n=1 Tax=Variovorax sp. PAMC 28711 TaxID=1795631 RepID=UPI00078B66DE|nr:type IV pilus modification protein PilV [Variovorax sp. PAMC 28711]AMM24846.1 fimbrial assembly protein [Variovorax sp. PAMC 28711]
MKKPHLPASRAGQRGIALLEVLVSILLFSLGILGLVGLQARAVTTSVDAEDRGRAALLANEIASTMWLTDSVTVNGTAWQARVSAPTTGGLSNGTVTITPVAGTTNSADILIQWRSPTRTASSANAGSQLSTRVTLP